MRLRRTVMLLLAVACESGCQEESDPTPCVLEERPVNDLGREIDGVIPADIIEIASRSYRGDLRWNGGGDYLIVSPSQGTTGFEYSARFLGDATLLRNSSTDPDDLLACPSRLRLDMEMTFKTDDGTLDERWLAAGEVQLSGFLPVLEMKPDVEQTKLLEVLSVEETEASTSRFEEREYVLTVLHNLSGQPPTVHGDLTFIGREAVQTDGEINDLSLVRVRIADWMGSALE